eukprot:scaffold10013_cov63-Phaeocystis_antarctica.AAC.1
MVSIFLRKPCCISRGSSLTAYGLTPGPAVACAIIPGVARPRSLALRSAAALRIAAARSQSCMWPPD